MRWSLLPPRKPSIRPGRYCIRLSRGLGERGELTALDDEPSVRNTLPTFGFRMERVTGIGPALSAWESERSHCLMTLDLGERVSVVGRIVPRRTAGNGTRMARRSWPE